MHYNVDIICQHFEIYHDSHCVEDFYAGFLRLSADWLGESILEQATYANSLVLFVNGVEHAQGTQALRNWAKQFLPVKLLVLTNQQV